MFDVFFWFGRVAILLRLWFGCSEEGVVEKGLFYIFRTIVIPRLSSHLPVHIICSYRRSLGTRIQDSISIQFIADFTFKFSTSLQILTHLLS